MNLMFSYWIQRFSFVENSLIRKLSTSFNHTIERSSKIINHNNMSQAIKQLWKHSASLIILGKSKDAIKPNSFNYKVLVLQRPAKGSYPDAIVFPGGVTETVDEINDWLQFYRKFGIDDNKLKTIIPSCTQRPSIFNQSNENHICRDMSLRITAIRETFEELGILICKNKQQLDEPSLFSNLTNNFDVAYWQKEVYKDASKFLKLCEILDVVPDLWSLHLWSVWLSPTFKRQKRFETVFYIVGVNDQPNVHVTNSEVERSLWQTPAELLSQSQGAEVWLPPPQFYELSRLNSEKDLDRIIPFAKERSTKSETTLMFPIPYFTNDGVVNCYPGDDLYPKHPDYTKTTHKPDQYANKSCEQFRSMAQKLHRSEMQSARPARILYNIQSSDNHMNPQTIESAKL